MSPFTQDILLAIGCAAIIGIGWRWGALAINNAGITRQGNPVAFWMVMAMATAGLVGCILLAFADGR